jgi:glycosyltransferase involved in cell wall biosynthesis
MKITFTTPQTGPLRSGQGGIETLVLGWSAELARRGHDVVVASISRDGSQQGHRYHPGGYRTVEVARAADLHQGAEVVIANNRPYHLTHVPTAVRQALFMHNTPAAAADNDASRGSWPPVGVWVERGANLLQRGGYLDSLAAMRGDSTTLACSDWLASRLEMMGARRVLVVHPHVDPAFPAHRSVAERSGVLFVGRLVWRKGLADLVALAQSGALPGELTVTDFAGAGQGADSQAVRRMLTDSGVKLTEPPASPAAVAQLMASAEALLLPSSDEPFGMVSIEGRCSGTPVVAYDSGGIRETAGSCSEGLYLARTGDLRQYAHLLHTAVQRGPWRTVFGRRWPALSACAERWTLWSARPWASAAGGQPLVGGLALDVDADPHRHSSRLGGLSPSGSDTPRMARG